MILIRVLRKGLPGCVVDSSGSELCQVELDVSKMKTLNYIISKTLLVK